jgi:hypothetical protein
MPELASIRSREGAETRRTNGRDHSLDGQGSAPIPPLRPDGDGAATPR